VHIYKLNDILDPMTPYRQNVKNDGIFYGIWKKRWFWKYDRIL
jgi:hypothetical protein